MKTKINHTDSTNNEVAEKEAINNTVNRKKFSLPKKFFKYSDEVNNHIRTLKIGCGVLTAIVGVGLYGLYQMPSEILLYQTPNLETGSTRHITDVPAYSVYGFGLYVMQQVYNTSNLDGGIERNIKAYGNYLSPEFQQQLIVQDKIDKKNAIAVQDVSQEVREMEGVRFDKDHVFQLTPSKWVVYLDLQIVDRFNGEKVKDAFMRYPVVVEKADFNPSVNPTGLRLTGFYQTPFRINVSKKNTHA